MLSLDARFKLTDFHELKFASENAKSAKTMSMIAIIIVIGLFSLFLTYHLSSQIADVNIVSGCLQNMTKIPYLSCLK